MAGQGQWFRDAGFDVPKTRSRFTAGCSSAGRSRACAAASPTPPHPLFIARATDRPQAFLAHQRALEGIPSYAVVELRRRRRRLRRRCSRLRRPQRHKPFVVYNIDTHVRPYAMRGALMLGGEGLDPRVPGRLCGVAVRRRRRTGPRVGAAREGADLAALTVGLYGFDSFALAMPISTSVTMRPPTTSVLPSSVTSPRCTTR